MKIVLIPHLPTLYGRRYNLAKNLAAQGHEVHFVTWDMPYPLTRTTFFAHLQNSLKRKTRKESKNLFIHQVGRLPFFWPVINGLIFKRQIRQLYEANNADVIISQAFTNETEPPLTYPLVYDINDDHQAFADIYGSRVYKLAYKLLGVTSVIKRQSRAAMLVTVVSDKLSEFARQYNDNVVKIPNGVEAAAVIRALSGKEPARRHSLVYVSNFGKWSRLTDIIATVADFKDIYPDIRLEVVGGGTELANAKKQVERLGLKEYVVFHGKVADRKKVFRLIAQGDVCLNISEKNAFRDAASPIKVIEYSAMGKKIISSKVIEVQKLRLPNMFFFDGKSNEGLKNAIVKAFESEPLTASGRNVILKNYSWESLTDKLVVSINAALRVAQKTRTG